MQVLTPDYISSSTYQIASSSLATKPDTLLSNLHHCKCPLTGIPQPYIPSLPFTWMMPSGPLGFKPGASHSLLLSKRVSLGIYFNLSPPTRWGSHGNKPHFSLEFAVPSALSGTKGLCLMDGCCKPCWSEKCFPLTSVIPQSDFLNKEKLNSSLEVLEQTHCLLKVKTKEHNAKKSHWESGMLRKLLKWSKTMG